jgi:hypothetical protein
LASRIDDKWSYGDCALNTDLSLDFAGYLVLAAIRQSSFCF